MCFSLARNTANSITYFTIFVAMVVFPFLHSSLPTDEHDEGLRDLACQYW